MITVMIEKEAYDMTKQAMEEKFKKARIIETEFEGMEESSPLVYHVNQNAFYQFVSMKRLQDVISGYADDLKVQTAKLHNVEMMKYMSESVYRKIVQDVLNKIEDNQPITKEYLEKFVKNGIRMDEVTSALKMALIKTTKGPNVFDLLEALGTKESLIRFEAYLKNYKYRI
jgi:glutamyl/glutaminyl-tRNA synthetase